MATAPKVKHHDYLPRRSEPMPSVRSVSGLRDGRSRHHLDVSHIFRRTGWCSPSSSSSVLSPWWSGVSDVIAERMQGDHTRFVQISHRYGQDLLFIASCDFLFAWFWAFFNAALFPG